MADKAGQCRNVQGGGEDEVVLGGGARGGNNLNIHEDEAKSGHGAKGNVDRDEEHMLRLMCALRIKVSIPIFKGNKNEDPIEFKMKALDYMEAMDIPVREHVVEFCHCLEGKARMWYDEITLPCMWNDLMGMFSARFCIYGKSNEDWYHHWASLHFNPVSDADIDNLINQVRSVAHLLNFPDMVVLATLKNMFPSYRLHFLNVNDLPTMFRMLRACSPGTDISPWLEPIAELPHSRSTRTRLLLYQYQEILRRRSLTDLFVMTSAYLMRPLTDSKIPLTT